MILILVSFVDFMMFCSLMALFIYYVEMFCAKNSLFYVFYVYLCSADKVIKK